MSLTPDTLRDRVVVADGGWSTILYDRRFPRAEPAEQANRSRPDLVGALAREYLAAGAQIISTNTFAANRLAAQRAGLDGDLPDLNRRGAALARAAIDEAGADAIVAGVIGPSGSIVAIQEVGEEELTEIFAEQATALAAGGADWIVLETFSELAELVIALRAVKQATGRPVVASMSFDSGPQRTRTVMGAAADEAAGTLERAGADLVGANCGAGIATALPAVVALRGNCDRPVWLKASAGLPDLENDAPVYRHRPEDVDEFVGPLLDAGVNVLGGCCGMGPAHVRRLAALTDAWRRRQIAGPGRNP